MADPSPRTSYESLLSSWVDPTSILAPDRVMQIDQSARYLVEWPEARSLPEARMAYDMQTYLPDDILVKVDRSAMSVSLETRAPLLDHRVVELAFQLQGDQKIRKGRAKDLLRR